MSRRIAVLVLALAIGIFAPPSTAADLPRDASPESVAQEAYLRMQAGDWERAAEMFDPAETHRFRMAFAKLMESVGDAGSAVLGFDASDDLTDVQFLGKFMRGFIGMAPGLKLQRQEILGGVSEGADRLHLVTRNVIEISGTASSKMDVITLVRTPEGWRMAFKGDFESMLQGLEARLRQTQDESPASSKNE